MGLQVLLVHGMGRTPLSLLGLAHELRRDGHAVHSVGYVAAWETVARIVGRVHERLMRLATADAPYVAIGHSLGGVLLRAALARAPELPSPPRHLIMLGTPNQTPRLAGRVRRLWPYRLMSGEVGQLLADPSYLGSMPVPRVPHTIIAGTGGPRGPWSPFGQEANDMVVAVNETRCAPGEPVIELPVRHTFMMNDRRVRQIIRELLAQLSA